MRIRIDRMDVKMKKQQTYVITSAAKRSVSLSPIRYCLMVICCFAFLQDNMIAQTTVTFPAIYDVDGTWTCPAGITSVVVKCWGAGGGGAGDMGASAGGGGGGGGYSSKTITVVPGTTYNVEVGTGGLGAAAGAGDGTDGGDSWFDNNTVILAKGGKKGLGNGGAAAAGGAGGIGTYTVTGGNGGVGGGTDGGGGGESGGVTAGGANASSTTPGAGASGDGGFGGTGTATDGVAGVAPGGGGGGGGDDAGDDGAAGAAGRVIILPASTWTCVFQVTSLQVECWGGGGGGGGSDAGTAGSGGGGGAYAIETAYAVNPGTAYTVTIGAAGLAGANNTNGGNGGDSWFSTTGTVYAQGGRLGVKAGGTAGVGGLATSPTVGDTKYAGGAAAVGGATNGGGGGEAGGSSGTGDAASADVKGSGVNADGGDGGNGGTLTVGNPGSNPGGGGGGAHDNGYAGAAGGVGQIKITYSTCTNACTQASSLAASNIGTTTMTLSWTRGTGTGGVLIVVGTSVITDPTDNVSAANAAYGSAPAAGNGKAVYDGTGTSVNITGLSAGTTYYFAAYEFNTGRCYNLTSEGRIDAGVATCSAPGTQTSAFTRSNEAATSMTLNWTRGNGSKVLVLARGGSAVATDPTDGATYTANAAYGSGTAIGSAYVVYDGTGTSVDLTNLTSGTTYHFAAYEYNTPTACYNLTELTGNYCNKPVTPGSITGTAAQCKNTTGQTYSIAAVTGASGYTWTVPTNWSVTAGAGTNSITVTTSVNAADNGNVTVTANNACGSSSAQTLAVTLDVPAQTSTLNSN